MIVLYGFVGLAVLIAGYAITAYNGLVALRQRAHQAWSDIDVQLKRRYNLIPNLVETVKGYARHEAETLESVVKARNSAIANDGTPAQQALTENMLSGMLRQLFAVAEAYPELKANSNFEALQSELSQIEETIQRARRFYNGSVQDLNTKVEQFPSNIIARQFGFGFAEYFELSADDSAARDPVQVSFGGD
ncbi:MAG: LemA family protein [Pseudomonadota bacterium]